MVKSVLSMRNHMVPLKPSGCQSQTNVHKNSVAKDLNVSIARHVCNVISKVTIAMC